MSCTCPLASTQLEVTYMIVAVGLEALERLQSTIHSSEIPYLGIVIV
jgi:hypothetical protein